VETVVKSIPEKVERQAQLVELVQNERDRAVAIAYHMLGGDREAALDAAQNAFLRAFEALPVFRGDSSLSTWFLRILIREAARLDRKSFLRERWDRLWGRAQEQMVDLPRGDPEVKRQIALALEKLSQQQRAAFAMVHLEGMTVVAAADVLAVAPGTLKSHLHRALATLRRELGSLWEEVQ